MKKALISVGLLVIAGTAVATVSITGRKAADQRSAPLKSSGAISQIVPPLVN